MSILTGFEGAFGAGFGASAGTAGGSPPGAGSAGESSFGLGPPRLKGVGNSASGGAYGFIPDPDPGRSWPGGEGITSSGPEGVAGTPWAGAGADAGVGLNGKGTLAAGAAFDAGAVRDAAKFSASPAGGEGPAIRAEAPSSRGRGAQTLLTQSEIR